MRRSLRLHPSSPAVPPLEDDNLLSEILRLRRFRRRNSPMLGFFHKSSLGDLSFAPSLEPPNRVSPGRLSLRRQRDGIDSFSTHGCRHGLLLVTHYNAKLVDHVRLVWDPITGEQHRLPAPPGFNMLSSGAVLRAAGDGDHFQVVFVGIDAKQRAVASVYSSATGVWSNPASTLFQVIPNASPQRTTSSGGLSDVPGVLVGSSLYWFLSWGAVGILEFDLERHNLAMIGLPAHLQTGLDINYLYSIMRADDGGLGFLYLSGLSAQLWKRKTEHDGVASWVVRKTIELDKLLQLPLNPGEGVPSTRVIGFDEDNNTVFLRTIIGIFTIHLDSMQFKKLSGPSNIDCCYPFESVYGAGI